jgi:acyl carrier protein
LEERLRAIMADIFTIDVSRIGEDASMKSIEQWDSLAHINLISALEEEFGVEFEIHEIELMTDFVQVMETLSGKL